MCIYLIQIITEERRRRGMVRRTDPRSPRPPVGEEKNAHPLTRDRSIRTFSPRQGRFVLFLLAFEFEGLGEFLPLAVLGYLEGGAFLLLKNIGGVVLLGEGGGEVFGAVVVDEGEGSRLPLDFSSSDDPAEGVVLLAEIAWERAVEFLSRHLYILVVEVDLQINLIFIIIKVRAERTFFFLGEYSGQRQLTSEKYDK